MHLITIEPKLNGMADYAVITFPSPEGGFSLTLTPSAPCVAGDLYQLAEAVASITDPINLGRGH